MEKQFEKAIPGFQVPITGAVMEFTILEGGFEANLNTETRQVRLEFYPINMPFMRFVIPLHSLTFIQFANKIETVRNLLSGENGDEAA